MLIRTKGFVLFVHAGTSQNAVFVLFVHGNQPLVRKIQMCEKKKGTMKRSEKERLRRDLEMVRG